VIRSSPTVFSGQTVVVRPGRPSPWLILFTGARHR
jgi:hypothetical protein